MIEITELLQTEYNNNLIPLEETQVYNNCDKTFLLIHYGFTQSFYDKINNTDKDAQIYFNLQDKTYTDTYDKIRNIMRYEFKNYYYEVYVKIFININQEEVFKSEKHYADRLKTIKHIYYSYIVFKVLDLISFQMNDLHALINEGNIIELDKEIYYTKLQALYNETIKYYDYLKINDTHGNFSRSKKTSDYASISNVLCKAFAYYGMELVMGRENYKRQPKKERFIVINVNKEYTYRTQKHRYAITESKTANEIDDIQVDNYEDIRPKIKLLASPQLTKIIENFNKYLKNTNLKNNPQEVITKSIINLCVNNESDIETENEDDFEDEGDIETENEDDFEEDME